MLANFEEAGTDPYNTAMPGGAYSWMNMEIIRKYNCVWENDPGFGDRAALKFGMMVDAVPGFITGKAASSHIEGDGLLAIPNFNDLIQHVYCVLHSGFSLVFGMPVYLIASLINDILGKADPLISGKISPLPSAFCPVSDALPVAEPTYTPDWYTFNVVSFHRQAPTYIPGIYDTIVDGMGSLPGTQAVYNPVTP